VSGKKLENYGQREGDSRTAARLPGWLARAHLFACYSIESFNSYVSQNTPCSGQVTLAEIFLCEQSEDREDRSRRRFAARREPPLLP
jgi:hypothetical protein